MLKDLRSTNAARRLAGEPVDKPLTMAEVLNKASGMVRVLDDEMTVAERLGKPPALAIMREFRQLLRDFVEMAVLAKRVGGEGSEHELRILMPEAFFKAAAPTAQALPAPIAALPAPETPCPETEIPKAEPPPSQAQKALSSIAEWKRRSLRDAEWAEDNGRTPTVHPAFQLPSRR